jgi:hypothetical protein
MSFALFDFECSDHGIFESLRERKFWFAKCPVCGKRSHKIISAPRINLANEDAPHIREAADVLIDKETARFSDDPHVRALAEKPTRSNLNSYLKAKNIRYVENEGGAPPRYRKPEGPDRKALVKELFEKKRKRDRLEVRT